MRKVTIAAIQMACEKRQEDNLLKAENMVRTAARQGANVILLPELFDRPYFCQERRYDYYAYAKSADEHEAVIMAKRLAKELGVVIPVSFYELAGNETYNSLAMIDSDGENLGIYRKMHIPDDH